MCCTIQKIPYPFLTTQILASAHAAIVGLSVTYFYRLEQRFRSAGQNKLGIRVTEARGLDYLDWECFSETRNAGIWPPPLVTLAKPVALRRVK
jgi:hypothetical protein